MLLELELFLDRPRAIDRRGRARFDGLVTIPMAGRGESINVGMAAAVLCFEAARQLADNGYAPAMIMISTHAGADYADLIDESPAQGFVAKADLSAAAIHRILDAN